MIKKQYKIDFALVTLTGNITRYLLVRPVVEKDSEIKSRWYPIRTWYDEDPLRVFPAKIRIRLRHFFDTWRLYASSKPDAVVMHAFETYYIYAIYKKFLHPDVILVNNPDASVGHSKLYRFAVSQTNLLIPWSEYFKNEIIENYPDYPINNIRVIHPGIDLSKWKKKDIRKSITKKNILFVGGDIRRKGGDTLIHAFQNGLYKDYQLHIATQSGYLDPELRKRINFDQNIHLYLDLASGSDELINLYHLCDVLIIPTRRDSNSWVALEAMASGIPVIINPMWGISDIIIDDVTGVSIPPNSPEAIISAVNKLFDNTDYLQNIVKNARMHVEKHFDVEKNTGILMSWIKELIDCRY